VQCRRNNENNSIQHGNYITALELLTQNILWYKHCVMDSFSIIAHRIKFYGLITKGSGHHPWWPSGNMLATGLKVCVLKSGWGQWLYKDYKTHSTTPFGHEEKLSALCNKILWHVKDPCTVWQMYFASKIYGRFSLSFSCFTTRGLCRYMPDTSGREIRND
jgi:hypothetical protein